MTVTEAIDRSISHNEIVTINISMEDADELCETLFIEADDSTGPMKQPDGEVLTEYWGTTEDGKDWRVYVVASGA